MTISSSLRSISLLFCWFAVRTASAQPQDMVFGEVRRFGIPGASSRVQILSGWNAGTAVVLTFDARAQSVNRTDVDSSWRIMHTSTHVVSRPFDDVLVMKQERNGRASVVFVDRRSRSFSVTTSIAGDSIRFHQTVELAVDPTGFLAEDITNDGLADILMYDRNTPGIVPIIARSNGTFSIRKVIAPDDLVGAMCVTSLNQDGVKDIVLYDWVKSELHLWYGVGNVRFLDQGIYGIEGVVDTILSVRLQRRSKGEFLVGLREPSRVDYWRGNDLGEFVVAGSIALDTTGSAVTAFDGNNDRMDEILTIAENGSALVSVREDRSLFSKQVRFGVPEGFARVTSVRMPDGSCDVLAASNRTDSIWALRTGRATYSENGMADMIAGRQPNSIAAADLNGDGASDLLVANPLDSTIALYWGRTGRGVSGPMTYAFQFRPAFVALHSVSDSGANVLVGSSDERSVAFVSLSFSDRSVTGAAVPTEGVPALLASFPAPSGVNGFAVLNSLESAERFSLSFFERVGAERYLEQSFRLTAPIRLLGAAVADYDRDGRPDIVYAYHMSDSSDVGIAVAFGDSAQSMKKRLLLQDLPRKNVQRIRIWVNDLDGDDVPDVLVHVSDPVKEFWVLRTRPDSTVDSPFLALSGVDIQKISDVRVRDVDYDGSAEAFVLDRTRHTVGWFRPMEGHRASFQEVSTDERIVAFDLGDVDADGREDLVYVTRQPDLVHIRRLEILPARQEGPTP